MKKAGVDELFDVEQMVGRIPFRILTNTPLQFTLSILLLLRDRLVGLSRLPMTHHVKPHLAAEHKKRQHRTHSSTGSPSARSTS